ncbi:MAG: hypothetical protein QOG53_2614 [Frankiales bacterium]|jgi:GGDEF domain-containing protein|nr:hypothetical protein [Frankiales bacterium]
MNHQARTWGLTALIAAIAGVLYALWVYDVPHPHEHIPVIVFVILFAAAEIFVVHVEFRKDAHTLSLVDIPLVLGLFFASPAWLVPAHLAGAAVALGLFRRQRPMKLGYNLAAFALEDTLALVVFHSIGHLDPLAPTSWVAAFLAALVAALVAVISVTVAIAVSGGTQTWHQRLQSLQFAVAATFISASTAIALAVLIEVDDRAVVLLATPIAAIYAAYRLALAQRNDRRSMELLHTSAGLLQGDQDTAHALQHLLDQIRNLFQADVAALTYVPVSDPTMAALWVVGPGTGIQPMVTQPRDQVWSRWRDLAPRAQATLVGSRRKISDELLTDVSIDNGMVAPLILGSRTVGYLLVANRLNDVSRFSTTDLLVLETLAQQLSVGVDDGELERPLYQLRVFERQLAYRENHDALTGLATRLSFTDQLSTRLTESSGEPDTLATIVVDLADPGGALVPDAALLVVAERLRRLIRQEDVLGRLDHQRFALVATLPPDPQVATELSERIETSLVRPIHVDAHRVDLIVQIGYAINSAGDSAETLLDRAYLDMVRA